MNHLLFAIENALQASNFYAALAIALALPDICSWVESGATSKSRYIAWFQKYLQPRYTQPTSGGRPQHIFLNGSDCYALRCAYLHEGRDDIVEQRARQVLDAFQFVVPPNGWTVHRNQLNNVLQLQVDVFCHDVVEAVTRFLSDIAGNAEATERINKMLLIRNVNGRPL
ncbi:MAG: hypothetical protein EHM23_18005 [Acidobacteria bacterium]|nr:MAG: hypothetical protein EHM23_18005 [Acidobacteriota bacterium]